MSENERLREETSGFCREFVSAREGFEQQLVTERKLFETQLKATVDHFQSKIEEQRKLFCTEVPQLKDESTRFAVDETMQWVKSSEVWQDYEGRAGAKPERRIPSLSQKWNANSPAMSLCDMISEIKRAVPIVTVSALL
jgi:hypothetical protein